jgi:thiol-disulfide isomerase/thioredoxin
MIKIILGALFLLLSSPLIGGETTAPAFTIEDEMGLEIDLPREHDGVDIYLFWASWCPYCKALMPHLQSILDEYGDDVRIYAFNIKDDEDPAVFLDQWGYDFVLIPEADGLMEAYGVKGTPGLFIVDGKGKIRFNLYEMIFSTNEAYKELKNSQKAARRAPAWAAEIRKVVDQILDQ